MQLAIVNKDGEPDESKYLCGLALATIVNASRRSVPYLLPQGQNSNHWTHLTQTACCRSVSAEIAAPRFQWILSRTLSGKAREGSVYAPQSLFSRADPAFGWSRSCIIRPWLFLRTAHDIRHCLTRPGKFQTAAGSRRSRGGVPERSFNCSATFAGGGAVPSHRLIEQLSDRRHSSVVGA